MSRPVPRNDVEIEGRFVLLELGPHEQTKRSKKEFSVGKRRWQLSAVRVDEHTSVTLSTSSLFWDKCLASVTLKLVLFPENQPVVVHNRQEVDLPLNGPHTWTVTDGCKSTRCLVEIEFRNITELKDFSDGLEIRNVPDTKLKRFEENFLIPLIVQRDGNHDISARNKEKKVTTEK
ncbi:uncharacterized protein [Triticum aestivum]|uniref:uncharacterized protein n=1 Tax=Triticum aestivum TaxID=4565 RepID=UPI001D00A77F|nr:uncharacterized protein LOC123114849 [Triticum aestivum]